MYVNFEDRKYCLLQSDPNAIVYMEYAFFCTILCLLKRTRTGENCESISEDNVRSKLLNKDKIERF